MSAEIKAYKCEKCNRIYEKKSKADNCCKCRNCKAYIGKWDKKMKWVHCSYGYTCDSYSTCGEYGTYSRFENNLYKERGNT